MGLRHWLLEPLPSNGASLAPTRLALCDGDDRGQLHLEADGHEDDQQIEEEEWVKPARSSTHLYDIFAMSDALTDVKYPV